MKVKICVGTTCHLMGASALVEVIESFEDEIKKGISLEYSTCFSACQGQFVPPVVKIGEEFFGNMTPENLKNTLIAKLQKGE